jgi:hypothetical protein
LHFVKSEIREFHLKEEEEEEEEEANFSRV